MRGKGILMGLVVALSVTACDVGAGSYDSVEELGAAIEAGTEIACTSWSSTKPSVELAFVEHANCDGWLNLYIFDSDTKAEEFMEGMSSHLREDWFIVGDTWGVSCRTEPAGSSNLPSTNPRAALDCTAIHKALGGTLMDPTGTR